MIEPGVPGGEVAAAELAGAEERAVEGDVDDGAPGVGRHVLGRHREVGGGVVDEHVGQAELGLGGVEGGGDLLGLADVAGDGQDPARRSPSMASPAGVEVLGLAAERSTMAAPRRANSVAMALPRPVPPPVTNTTWPS